MGTLSPFRPKLCINYDTTPTKGIGGFPMNEGLEISVCVVPFASFRTVLSLEGLFCFVLLCFCIFTCGAFNFRLFFSR